MTVPSQGGGGKLLLVFVVLGILGAGAWNYHRNLVAERAEHARPYASLSEADLQILIDASRAEVEQWQRLDAESRARSFQGRSGGALDEQIREFERAQQLASSKREVAGGLASREATLRALEEESARRSAGSGLEVHLRRLLTI